MQNMPRAANSDKNNQNNNEKHLDYLDSFFISILMQLLNK